MEEHPPLVEDSFLQLRLWTGSEVSGKGKVWRGANGDIVWFELDGWTYPVGSVIAYWEITP